MINIIAVPTRVGQVTALRRARRRDRIFAHCGSKHDMIGPPGTELTGIVRRSIAEEPFSESHMIEGHRLHESHIDGRGVGPVDVFSIDEIRGPDGLATIVLRGELDMAASAALRRHVDAAAGLRGLVIDLGGATFIDSSMLKELLRASAELSRYETRLVLASIPPPVERLFQLTRTHEMFTVAEDRDAALRLLSS
jgi:anti-anti-sigma factor